MSNPENKEFYYVDPGIGKKLHNCPYSLSKDGNDIREFIIPPYGYELSGFVFFPLEHKGDGFFDGKIVAQYKKKPLLPKIIKSSLYLLSLLGIIVALGFLAYHFQNSRPKPVFEKSNTQKPNTESPAIPVDSTTQTQVYCTSTNTEVVVEQETEEIVVGKESEEAIVEKEQKEVLAEKKQKEVPIEKKPEKDIVKKEQKEVLVEKEQKEVPVEKKPEKEEILTKGSFQQEFWDLIHKRDPKMDSYHYLYVNNKGKVKGEEYDYLRLVILDSTKAYKEWYRKLKAVPESELQDINTIAALRDALK